MTRVCLTSRLVDSVTPPDRGEIWLGEHHVQYFGLRVWAGKKAGSKAFAIRLRDLFGVLIREAYRPDRDFPFYSWHDGHEKPLGYFLDHARRWARDRIAVHRGNLTSKDHRHIRWQKRKAKILTTRLDDAIKTKIKKLNKKSNNHLYVFNIENLIDKYVPDEVLLSTFRDVPIRMLADAILAKPISYGTVKVLRGFIGGVFSDAAQMNSVLHYKLESIQRRCARNLAKRKAPPYPKILDITRDDYQRFFNALEEDEHWRQSLALRFYFGTEARLQPILRARWSDIVDRTWYPFVPEERGLWQGSKQRLSKEALRILELIENHHRNEALESPYLFPSPADPSKPIKTVQRHWKRWSDTMGWHGLPLSHVVLGHLSRANPSYFSFYYQYSLDSDRPKSIIEVSKVKNGVKIRQ